MKKYQKTIAEIYDGVAKITRAEAEKYFTRFAEKYTEIQYFEGDEAARAFLLRQTETREWLEAERAMAMKITDADKKAHEVINAESKRRFLSTAKAEAATN